MKILLVHQYFKTPDDGGGIRSYHVATGLVARGHEVVVITAHSKSGYLLKNVEGVKVHYLPIAYNNSFGFVKRVFAFIRFMVRSLQLAQSEKGIDLAYVITTPLSTAIVALYLRSFRNIPYLFEVGDLWPEVPVRMGILKNPFLKMAAYRLESLAYKNAKGLIALSPGIASYMLEKAPHQRIVTIPNMSDLDYYQPTTPWQGGELKILYCGALGVANHLEYLLDAAKECLRSELPVSFTIVGEGARKPTIATLAQSLSNVTLREFVDRQTLKEIIATHDAFYVSFMNVPVLHTG
ncbi:MAG: glycosyltransferase family 4 protein, partial [Bacteroidota bacterium]